ncbi:MAG: tetratricopeptide repeat protein [Deltaproteobacteria bacterium]|jgi:tetratricopeptide (TPR) repeat protein|nr:tetratricopeptide repeat protein [Deltaproteobacteria bacterium]
MGKKVSIDTLVKQKDAFFTTSERVFNFYSTHAKGVWAVAIAVVVVIAGLLVWRNVADSRRLEAGRAYFEATVQGDPAQTYQNMEAVREEWGGKAGRLASYGMLNALVAEEKYPEAKALLKEILGSLSPAEMELQGLLRNLLASLEEETGELEAAYENYLAAKTLSDLEQSSPSSAPYRVAVLSSLARVALALGRVEDARKHYNLLRAEFPQTIKAFEASFRLAELPPDPQAPPAASPAAAASPAPAEAATVPATASADPPAEDSAAAPAGDSAESPAGDSADAPADDNADAEGEGGSSATEEGE